MKLEGHVNKEKYKAFCNDVFIPIFSKPWWMDAICGENNWDVWLYDKDGEVFAAAPYYMEKRGSYNYVTKAPLTQNNGLILKYPKGQKLPARYEFEEKIINEFADFLEGMDLDVYEQQFHHTFNNWAPFFWRSFTEITRYTFVIEDTSNLETVFEGFSANCRKNIRKAQKTVMIKEDLAPDEFYNLHETIFLRQGLKCPFSRELWSRLYEACKKNNCGKIIYAQDSNGNIHSLMFIVWDEDALYPLLGGYMEEYASSQSYSYLTYDSIRRASEAGLKYDFEGSVIKRINHSFRNFGGIEKPYFRIRKVFNPEIVRKEAEDYIQRLESEKQKND